jgi:hypothetical protein
MKTKSILFLLLIAAFILPGCVFSLYPLYTNNDLVYDARLEGVWGASGDKDVWKFENLLQHELASFKTKAERDQQEKISSAFINKNTYLLTYTDDGKAKQMQVNMCKLGNDLFLDLFPISENDQPNYFADQYVPVHSYAKIKMTGNKFEFYFFSSDFMAKLVKQNTIRIKHESFEHYILITASTDDLQTFVKKYANRQELYEKPSLFIKSAK